MSIELDNILTDIIDEFIEGRNVDIEAYCNKYPTHKDAILSKFRTAEFIKNSLKEENLSGKKLGEYIILQELGRGGMGIVFLATQLALSRLIAIKVLPPTFTHDKEILKNFQEEAKIIAKFNHPNIVPIYSISNEGGVYYIAMGYIPGISLKDVTEKFKGKNPHSLNTGMVREIIQGTVTNEKDILQKSITLKRGFKFWNKSYFQFIATIGAEIADALSYAHQNGIFHGDLKPSNILLTNEAIPVIVDFGLSQDIKKLFYAKSDEFAGTLLYAAPEQIKENIIDDKTDIWSMGVTLYELLTLRNPFIDTTVTKTVDKILKSHPLPIRHYDKKIPLELEAIILKCLEKNPLNRYKSARELHQDLSNYLESKPTKARPAGILHRFYKLLRRHPSISFLTFGILFTTIITSLLFFNKKTIDLINKGNIYYDKGNYTRAINTYMETLNFLKLMPFLNQHRKIIFCKLGDAWLGNGIYEKAIDYYKMAKEVDPKYSPALYGLGEANFEKGLYDEAIKFFKTVIELSPSDRYSYYFLGRSFAYKGLFDEAIKSYINAIRLAPNDNDTLAEIVSTLHKKGLYKENEIKKYLKEKNLSDDQIKHIVEKNVPTKH